MFEPSIPAKAARSFQGRGAWAVARTYLIACVIGGSSTAPAKAQDQAELATHAFVLTGTAGIVSDYRDRGLSLSEGNPAFQGSATVAHRSGAFAFVWASTIRGDAELETQIGLGYSWKRESTVVDLWGTINLYPGAAHDTFAEVYVKAEREIGVATIAVGAAYAPPQKALDNLNNLYFSIEGQIPVPGSSARIAAAAGWENGAFAGNKIDWRVGVRRQISGWLCSADVVGAAEAEKIGSSHTRFVFAITRSF